jgi:predicted secreted protein
MAAQAGRDFTVSKSGSVIAGLRETSATANSEPVDITGKDDSGYRTLADFAGVEAIDITATGVWKDDIMRSIAFGGTGTTKLLTDITLDWGNGASLTGDFYLASYEAAGNQDNEETYNVSLQSSGEWTYTEAVV